MKLQIGGLCPRGEGHVWTYKDDDVSCGSKSWELFIEIEPEDVPYLPKWVRELVEFVPKARKDGAQ